MAYAHCMQDARTSMMTLHTRAKLCNKCKCDNDKEQTSIRMECRDER
jgi:hypothetical protein